VQNAGFACQRERKGGGGGGAKRERERSGDLGKMTSAADIWPLEVGGCMVEGLVLGFNMLGLV
jgi:hypothetical protein